MANLLKRIGAKDKKCLFIVHVHWIRLESVEDVNVQLQWKISNLYTDRKESMTTLLHGISATNQQLPINETLTMPIKLYLKSKRKALPKETHIKLYAKYGNRAPKEIGTIELNLGSYWKNPAREQAYDIKGPKGVAQACLTVHCSRKLDKRVKDRPSSSSSSSSSDNEKIEIGTDMDLIDDISNKKSMIKILEVEIERIRQMLINSK